MDEQSQATILLPDVQGSRNLIGRGLSVWIRFQIAMGQFDAARGGVLVGLANARHYTPGRRSSSFSLWRQRMRT